MRVGAQEVRMQIELPRAAEVSQAFPAWRLTNPILARLSFEYPQPREALHRFGLALSAQGQTEPALGILKAALALAPEEADLWNDLASAFYRAGQYAEAGAAQRRSLACDPAQPQGWLLLASIDSALGDAAAAETGYLAALKLDPYLSEAAFASASCVLGGVSLLKPSNGCVSPSPAAAITWGFMSASGRPCFYSAISPLRSRRLKARCAFRRVTPRWSRNWRN